MTYLNWMAIVIVILIIRTHHISKSPSLLLFWWDTSFLLCASLLLFFVNVKTFEVIWKRSNGWSNFIIEFQGTGFYFEYAIICVIFVFIVVDKASSFFDWTYRKLYFLLRIDFTYFFWTIIIVIHCQNWTSWWFCQTLLTYVVLHIYFFDWRVVIISLLIVLVGFIIIVIMFIINGHRRCDSWFILLV